MSGRKHVLIVSESRLIRDAWKILIENAAPVTVTTVPDESSAISSLSESPADTVVIESSKGKSVNLSGFLNHQDRPRKVVSVSDKDTIEIYRRKTLLKVSEEDFIKAITR